MTTALYRRYRPDTFQEVIGQDHVTAPLMAALRADLLRQREPSAKVRGIELSLPQRCGAHSASQTDIDEAFLAGKAAVEAAVAGYSDKMVAFRCTREGGYRCETVLEPLDIVANAEKTVPRAWINADGNGLEQPFIDYVLPLIQGVPRAPQEHSLPRYARLQTVLVSQEAENLLMGTAAQESALGEYIRQLGNGPALGIFQMEPETFDDIVRNYLA